MLSFNEFKQLTKKGNLIPLFTEIPADFETPVSAFLKIRTGKNDFLLESVLGGENWGRYSFLGTSPLSVFKSLGREIRVLKGKKWESLSGDCDPLSALKKYLKSFKPVDVAGLPRFFGGVVGYLSYDMVRYIEKIPATAVDELELPESYFMLTDTVIIFDNLRQSIFVVASIHIDPKASLRKQYETGCRKIERLVSKLRHPLRSRGVRSKGKFKTSLKASRSEKEFCALVEKAKEYIRAGDIFQMQLSMRFEGRSDIPPFELYRAIRRLNPSPYLYYLQLEECALVGASPEVMVRMTDSHVELRPIAGTRRRGRSAEDDAVMEKELKNDPKELAEHIMLVDLGRNDLGRVCEVGSVTVDELEIVEHYSHVMHLVSHVSGSLKRGKDAFDVIRATFPAGTLTGAPKIRAMEIIEELEGLRRGVYGGSVGYISFGGNMDMAITIRTALFHKKKIYIQAAAGIVYDSVPKLEYKECQNKARAMLKALETIGV